MKKILLIVMLIACLGLFATESRWQVRILEAAGTDFDDTGSNGVKLYESDGTTEYVGNVATSGAFSYDDNGVWYINIDTGDSGMFVVKTTTNGSTFTALGGYNPVWIGLTAFLPTEGGTMSGNIAMGGNDISGIDDITFDAGGTVAGITSTNLLDLSATETVTGNWTLSGTNDFTGTLKIDGTTLSATATELNTIKDARDANKETIEVTNTDRTLTDDETGLVAVSATSTDVNIYLPALDLDDNMDNIYKVIVRAITSPTYECTVHVSSGSGDLMTDKYTGTSYSSIVLDSQWESLIIYSMGQHFYAVLFRP